MPKEEFKREVEKELTGRETEPHEIIYFKIYKSQIPIIEQAIETATLMLGSDKSRGYCLEMICADFLAGANLDNGNPEILLRSIRQFFKFLPGEQQHAFLEQVSQKPSWVGFDQSSHACDWILKHTNSFVEKRCEGTDGDVSCAAAAKSYRFITNNTAAGLAMTQSKIWSRYAPTAIRQSTAAASTPRCGGAATNTRTRYEP
jgi:hypothetical protein